MAWPWINIAGIALASASTVWLVVLEFSARLRHGRRLFDRGLAENWAAIWRRNMEVVVQSVEGIHTKFGPDSLSMEKETKSVREGLDKAEAELRELIDPFREAGEVWGPLTQSGLALLLLALGFLLQLAGSIGTLLISQAER